MAWMARTFQFYLLWQTITTLESGKHHFSERCCYDDFVAVTRQILKIIKLQLHKEGCTWDAVPQEVRDFYWEEFQKHFIWDEAITAMLKVAWEKICTDQYADFTYRMRRSGNKQQCVSQEIWESWQKAWEDLQEKTAKKLGREPTPIELFTYTHTKDHDLNTFVDRRAMSVNENYTTAPERIVTSQTEESEAD
ncbi:uncharacterized protein LOC119371170 [Jatropha curcas]|uniref:uncharacterized protein LOC119371170 n=1 Tax=Jatropha curcas TaxID=180498 RepID=UPI001893C676|nr:uncharacterized protein LOC119371170 [Jatropha curcas]